MNVRMRKSEKESRNRTKSLIEKLQYSHLSLRNDPKSEIHSFKSDVKKSKRTFQQRFINFLKRHFKRNVKHRKQKKNENSKSKNIVNEKAEKPCPLKNIGSNCYLNAAFQGISSCRQFFEDISDLVTKYNKEIVNLRTFHDLLFHLNGGTFMSMEISKNKIFQNWNKSSQQDSFELLNYVLNEVYNEIREYEENRNRIEINNYQQWLQIQLPMKIILNYTIRCDCGSIEYSPPQSDLAFHLVIYNTKHNTIQNAFEKFFQDELVDGYNCNNIKCMNNKSYKCVKLQQPIPKTICIHLQKSHFNGTKMCKIKDKIGLNKLLTVKRSLFSVNEKSNLSKIENNESDLNTEKIIRNDKIQTCTKKAEDISNKSTKITNNNNNNNNYNNNNINNNNNVNNNNNINNNNDNNNKNTITGINFRKLRIRDLRLRNASCILSITNILLLSSDREILKVDCFDSIESDENRIRDSEVEDNDVRMRQETRSLDSEKRKAIYDSSTSFADNQKNQNNEIIFSENLFNENDLTSNPQKKNETQNENHLNNNVVKDNIDQNTESNKIRSSENLLNSNCSYNNVEKKTDENNEIISSENLVNENDKTTYPQNNNEIQIENGSNYKVIEDKTDPNCSNNSSMSSENLLNKNDLINDSQNKNEILNENHSNNHVDENKTDEDTENNEIICSENLLNANCLDNNVVDLETDQNIEINEISCAENLLNKNFLTNNARNNNEIQNKNHSNNNVVEGNTDGNTQNNSSMSSKNLLNGNCSDNNELQIEIFSNDKVIEDKTDLDCPNNSSMSSENLLNENDLTSNPQNKNETENEKEEDNNTYNFLMRQKTRFSDYEKQKGIYNSETSILFIIDNKTNQNNEIISSENLLNENDLSNNPQNNNEIQIRNCSNDKVQNKMEENTQNIDIIYSENLLNSNCSDNNVVDLETDQNIESNEISCSENLLNENDLASNSQNKIEILNENDLASNSQNKIEILNENHSNNNTVENKTDENTQNIDIIYSENLLNSNCSDSNVVDLEKDQNIESNEISCSENLLNENDLSNNPQNNNEILNENHSNNNTVENKTDENTQNNEIISSENLLNANCLDNNVVDLKTDQNTEINEISCAENLLNKNFLTNNAWNNNEIQNENHSIDNVVKDKTELNSKNTDLISSEKQVDESQGDETFSLKSIIVHLGSVNSGHYVCYKYFNNVWFLADDTRISKVTEEEVLRSDAYILFYEKN